MDAPLVATMDGLNHLEAMFQPFSDLDASEVIEIKGADVRVLLQTIKTLRHLTLLASRELGALRLMEEGRPVKTAVDGVLDEVFDVNHHNVVRPDFGGNR
jgi:hypothetical protein